MQGDAQQENQGDNAHNDAADRAEVTEGNTQNEENRRNNMNNQSGENQSYDMGGDQEDVVGVQGARQGNEVTEQGRLGLRSDGERMGVENRGGPSGKARMRTTICSNPICKKHAPANITVWMNEKLLLDQHDQSLLPEESQEEVNSNFIFNQEDGQDAQLLVNEEGSTDSERTVFVFINPSDGKVIYSPTTAYAHLLPPVAGVRVTNREKGVTVQKRRDIAGNQAGGSKKQKIGHRISQEHGMSSYGLELVAMAESLKEGGSGRKEIKNGAGEQVKVVETGDRMKNALWVRGHYPITAGTIE